MAKYKISGVWKKNGTITDYAFHTVTQDGITRAEKISKARAIALLETPGNSAVTWIWNYAQAGWLDGQTVKVVGGPYNKYLKSDPDNQLTDNLGHLINFDWITP